MKKNKKHIDIPGLICKKLCGVISSEESNTLDRWIDKSPENFSVWNNLKNQNIRENHKNVLDEYDLEKEWRNLDRKINKNRFNFSRTIYKIAASILLILSVTGTLFFLNLYNKNLERESYLAEKIVPGENKAVLTLSDGAKLELNNKASGTLAIQGNTTITQQENGKILYSKSFSEKSNQFLYNTIETPRGGTFVVLLPDGSLVWLNSESYIKFPVEFTEIERRVEISGEVYFEVAKSKTPFIVRPGKNTEIQVLGTHFNIKAYNGDNAIKTTLVEGSVKVLNFNNESTSGFSNNIVLKPGQQATVTLDGLITVNNVNTSIYTSWKDNKFLFKDIPLEDLMMDLSRWYDFEIIFADSSLKKLCFTGNIPRDTNIEEVILLLEKTKRIKFYLNNKKITVMKEP